MFRNHPDWQWEEGYQAGDMTEDHFYNKELDERVMLTWMAEPDIDEVSAIFGDEE